MCGIAGYIGKSPPANKAIATTLELMKNRGPDHQDSVTVATRSEAQVSLLHSRLSIIDLDPRSNQPFTVAGTTIVFNGEIYNYLELRADLVSRGIELLTESDTEVLLHYYRIYGRDCVEYFEGMWAFAIWDAEQDTLFLSRDRFAEKPLYFLETADGFYFGSETKFLRCLAGAGLSVNHDHLLRNMAHGYKALYKTADTYFENVGELRYAESMTIDSALDRKLYRYWKPAVEVDESMSLEDAIAGSRERLLNSVRIRLRSDVPLAFCLSGGVDSAAIVSIAAKEFNCAVTSFSIIDEDERYNEEDNILATVRDTGCEHRLLKIPQGSGLERLRDLIHYHDAPIATLSYYVHSLISESVHREGFKVNFSGTSADELFTGYYDHFVLHLNEMRNRDDYQSNYLKPWQENIGKFIRNEFLKDPDLYHRDPMFRAHVFDASDEISGYLRTGFREDYTESTFCDNLLRNRMLNELFHEATPVILHEDDLNSMRYSIENRSPYLDTELMRFAYSIPSRHLIRDGYGKHVLREALHGILNDQVRLDRRKKGFNASINSMLDLKDPAVRDDVLDSRSGVFDIVDREEFSKLLDMDHIPNHLSKFIFNVINTKIFLELY